MALFDLVRMTVSSSGTGTITLNAAVSGFLTFDLAGCSTAATGQAVTYAIADTGASEIGSGTYYSSALALTRTPVHSTNGNNAINMNNSAIVLITPQAKGIVGKVNTQVFTANGTYTPTTGLITATMECLGSGGGGGGAAEDALATFAAGGGGSGGYSRAQVTAASVGTSQTVTIGAIGAGGAAGTNNGSSGHTTSVGALCIALGGEGGGYADVSGHVPTGGSGAAKGTGDITMPGNIGGNGWLIANSTGSIPSGAGAPSALSGGSSGVFSADGSPRNGVAASANTGAGGSGGACGILSGDSAGGNGGSGIAIVTEYCSL